MALALELAERGRYSVSPNPMVGCVVARNGHPISEGWHQKAGQPHAEINALEPLDLEQTEGSTIYVTLEPCTTTGRTPPCIESVIAARPTRVVIATEDPSPGVAGRGIARLEAEGIEVTTGVLEAEARRLNEKFLTSVTQNRPFILIKAGMSLDGKLATSVGSSQWITSAESRQRSLLLREEYDSILVGSRTAFLDDPQLTRRLSRADSIAGWTRVILHTEGRLPHDTKLLSDGGRTILYTSQPDLSAGDSGLRVEVDAERAIESLVSDLHQRGIRSLIVEGGGQTISSFLEKRLWDRMILFVAPMMLGGRDAPSISGPDGVERLEDAWRMRFERVDRSGPDIVIEAVPDESK